MVDAGIRPIRERFLQPNHLFMLEFNEGFIFGRMMMGRLMNYRPWPLVNATGVAVTIPANSAQGELRFRDTRNASNEILFLSTTTSAGYPWFLYGSIGWLHEYVYVYYRFPEGSEIPGRWPNLDPPNPAVGDNLGYVNGEKSPYYDPSDYVVLTIPPTYHTSASYFNKNVDRPAQPMANILMQAIWFKPLLPGTGDDNLIGRLARREGSSEKAAPILKIGFGDNPLTYPANFAKDWNVSPITIDQASQLGQGGSSGYYPPSRGSRGMIEMRNAGRGPQ